MNDSPAGAACAAHSAGFILTPIGASGKSQPFKVHAPPAQPVRGNRRHKWVELRPGSGAGAEEHSNQEKRTVKRSMALTVGVLSLGVAVWFASKLWAEPTRPAASTQTRVAMLNLRWVIKNYSKYTAFI